MTKFANSTVSVQAILNSQIAIEEVVKNTYTINVYVNSGDITLDIRKDNSNVYTLDSDFSNTCYKISDGNEIIDRVIDLNDEKSKLVRSSGRWCCRSGSGSADRFQSP